MLEQQLAYTAQIIFFYIYDIDALRFQARQHISISEKFEACRAYEACMPCVGLSALLGVLSTTYLRCVVGCRPSGRSQAM